MEFVKVGKNYMIKNSNGRIISEKEKLQLETNELQIENESCGCSCPDKIKKVSKNKKRIKEIEEIEKENIKINIDLQPINSERIVKYIKKQTAQKKVDGADEIIKEADTTI